VARDPARIEKLEPCRRPSATGVVPTKRGIRDLCANAVLELGGGQAGDSSGERNRPGKLRRAKIATMVARGETEKTQVGRRATIWGGVVC